MGRIKCAINPGAVVFGLGGLALGLWEWWRRGTGLLEGMLPIAVVLVCAVLHEMGHVGLARWAGAEVCGLRLDVFGARLELSGMLSYGREVLVALGGPMANLLSAAAVYPLWQKRGGEGLFLFLTASVLLAAVNLLPVGTLDGGRILYCVTALLWGSDVARSIRGIATGVFLGGIWLLAVYGLLASARFLSLFTFSLCLLLRSLEDRGK
ncbi:MAG: hypothetical protein IJD38_11570 [Clostridia bacterium]|nr:hypothetical protein [Clostridia bacterium]